VVDTLGLLLLVSVTTAGVQDRTAAHRVLEQVRFVMASVLTVFADGGYAGKLVGFARRRLRLQVDIVDKPPEQVGVLGAAPTVGSRAHLRLADALPSAVTPVMAHLMNASEVVGRRS
jgi:hypothetical protein